MTEVQIIVAGRNDGDALSDGMRELTRKIAESTGSETGFGLGGEFGYGADYENAVFLMHPYCWCERDECQWCGPNNAPNFWHKPSGFRVHWYKWIGRDNETNDVDVNISEVIAECIASVAKELPVPTDAKAERSGVEERAEVPGAAYRRLLEMERLIARALGGIPFQSDAAWELIDKIINDFNARRADPASEERERAFEDLCPFCAAGDTPSVHEDKEAGGRMFHWRRVFGRDLCGADRERMICDAILSTPNAGSYRCQSELGHAGFHENGGRKWGSDPDAPAPDFRAVAERLAKALRERLEARNFYDRMITRRNAKAALRDFERSKEGV